MLAAGRSAPARPTTPDGPAAPAGAGKAAWLASPPPNPSIRAPATMATDDFDIRTPVLCGTPSAPLGKPYTLRSQLVKTWNPSNLTEGVDSEPVHLWICGGKPGEMLGTQVIEGRVTTS